MEIQESKEKAVLTYSSGTCFCSCEEKYRLRYVERLRPKREEGEALFVGSMMHTGLEVFARSGLDAGLAAISEIEAITPCLGPEEVLKVAQMAAKSRGMVRGAAVRWPEPMNMTETIVEMPVVNPETERSSRSFTYRGVIDGLDGKTLVDWKSCADPQQYLTQKTISYQPELYCLALRNKGVEVNSVLYRLVARPLLRLKQKETVAEYEMRVYEWLIGDPTNLVESEVFINQGRLEEARQWLWNLSKRIADNGNKDRWMRNEHACWNFNRACEYLPICTTACSRGDVSWIKNTQFEVSPEHHPEIARVEGQV